MTYKYIAVTPETHKLAKQLAQEEGRDIMFLIDILLKNYQITKHELGKRENKVS